MDSVVFLITEALKEDAKEKKEMISVLSTSHPYVKRKHKLSLMRHYDKIIKRLSDRAPVTEERKRRDRERLRKFLSNAKI